jgi:preprotein translocase subunit SecE
MSNTAVMNSKADTQNSGLDNFKLAVALALLVAGLGGFYYFAEFSVLVRVLALLAVTVAASAIALRTEKGRLLAAFFKDAQTEVRKVVWPTREETVQTTLVVMVVVIVVSIGLWLLDMLIGWLVQALTATGG